MTETYQITVDPIGAEITCREDQTLLDACLRAGVWVPHSCTHGTCGTCKVEVIDGEVDHGASSAFALMDIERDEGKTLLCCATPRSDVVFEADLDADEEAPSHAVQDYTGTVTAVQDIATDTRRVLIELDRDLAFDAGQYMAWQLPAARAGGKDGVTRTYSMANPPSQTRVLEFQIRRTPGGACSDAWVFGDLAAGDTVQLAGPYGRFTVRMGRREPAVLIAGGTGLAPIAAMIKRVLLDGANEHGDGPSHLSLYAGARTRAALYDVELFTELAAAHPDRFTYRPCLSEEEVTDTLAEQGFAAGMVTDVLAADHASLAGHVAYVCGPPAMVEASMKTLMSRRLFPRDINREEFLDESNRADGGLRSPLIKR
ncbi:MAG: 2Fe-2S iron-sulfur cluster binding domain-containing protein [Kineosporiaceae bacterium]|nr:2Fe-2S iron-sulfur cluster binding domain-containing protein [Kineosporiaceae bacterium]MBK8074779.1 2Fe-2S iron-sulfur cluster binding domain-containing protein [Kineosporiaceae bacterium]